MATAILFELLNKIHKHDATTSPMAPYNRLNDEFLVEITPNELSFATASVDEIDRALRLDVAFCPTTIFDVIGNGRLDVLKWCRENGHVDEHYYRYANLSIPAKPLNTNLHHYPWGDYTVMMGLSRCRNEAHLESMVRYFCQDIGDKKHYIHNIETTTSAVLEMYYRENNIALNWYWKSGKTLLGPIDSRNHPFFKNILMTSVNLDFTLEKLECLMILLACEDLTAELNCHEENISILYFIFDHYTKPHQWPKTSKLSDTAKSYLHKRNVLFSAISCVFIDPLAKIIDSYMVLYDTC
jgi:hypothetical protein